MSAPSYPLQTQVKLVVATSALHNYIRSEKPDDWIFKMYGEGMPFSMEESLPSLEEEVLPMSRIESHTHPPLDSTFYADEIALASQLRDSIATEIWNDYIHGLPPM
ncbi:hypothetical protein HN873_028448 [Arachis hypogaea]